MRGSKKVRSKRSLKSNWRFEKMGISSPPCWQEVESCCDILLQCDSASFYQKVHPYLSCACFYLVCPSFLVSHFHTPAGLVLIHLLLVMFLRPSIINLSKTDTLCTWTLKLDKINFSPPRLGKQRGEISRVDVRLDEWRMLKTTKGKAEKQATIRRHGGAERDWMWLQYSYYHCISNTAKVPQCFTAWGRILQYASQHVFLATLTQILHQ